MREVELKFALPAAAVPAFVRSAALASARPSRQRLLSIYFDTDRRELAAGEMALRLRRARGRWVQALKAGQSGLGGMHARDEWEFERPDASVDLALFAATPLAALAQPERLHERLGEVFRVEATRSKWVVEPAAGSRLEVVLDEGHVVRGTRRAPFCEVEIEVLAGDAQPAFDLALGLMETAPLRPSPVTKAQRGYRLIGRARLRPVKAAPVALARAMAPAEAARAVVGAGLSQLQANEEGVLASTDPEFVHQARVALRRMRSALRMFEDAVGAERARAWRSALAGIAGALGAARDWDVFATESLPHVLEAFADDKVRRQMARKAARRRRIEREAARAALLSPQYARVVLDVARWLSIDAASASVEAVAPLPAMARKVIRKRHKRLLADAARIRSLSVEERHRVRIDAKRLRYSVDALASVFRPKRVRRYVDVLGALQDALGNANDAATAGRLIGELEPPEALASFASGWFSALARGDPVVFDVLVQTLEETPRFWNA